MDIDSSTDPCRATNLYELCEQVCEAIEISPESYNQQHWISSRGCGTAFCRGGWMVALLEKPNRTKPKSGVSEKARHLLINAGIPAGDVDALFGGSACYPYKPEDPRFAQRGIDGMKEFMARYEVKLRATPTPPMKKGGSI